MFDPAVPIRGLHTGELVQPSTVLVEKTTTVHRNCDLQAIIDARNNARQVAAPGNTGDPDALTIHFRQTAQHRVSAITFATA